MYCNNALCTTSQRHIISALFLIHFNKGLYKQQGIKLRDKEETWCFESASVIIWNNRSDIDTPCFFFVA